MSPNLYKALKMFGILGGLFVVVSVLVAGMFAWHEHDVRQKAEQEEKAEYHRVRQELYQLTEMQKDKYDFCVMKNIGHPALTPNGFGLYKPYWDGTSEYKESCLELAQTMDFLGMQEWAKGTHCLTDLHLPLNSKPKKLCVEAAKDNSWPVGMFDCLNNVDPDNPTGLRYRCVGSRKHVKKGVPREYILADVEYVHLYDQEWAKPYLSCFMSGTHHPKKRLPSGRYIEEFWSGPDICQGKTYTSFARLAEQKSWPVGKSPDYFPYSYVDRSVLDGQYNE